MAVSDVLSSEETASTAPPMQAQKALTTGKHATCIATPGESSLAPNATRANDVSSRVMGICSKLAVDEIVAVKAASMFSADSHVAPLMGSQNQDTVDQLIPSMQQGDSEVQDGLAMVKPGNQQGSTEAEDESAFIKVEKNQRQTVYGNDTKHSGNRLVQGHWIAANVLPLLPAALIACDRSWQISA